MDFAQPHHRQKWTQPLVTHGVPVIHINWLAVSPNLVFDLLHAPLYVVSNK